MSKAVIFDMYETLVTFFENPVYFGSEIAADAGIDEQSFLTDWRATEHDRSVGKKTLEQVLEHIFRKYGCFSPELVQRVYDKRIMVNKACYDNLHSQIIPMLDALKSRGIKIALITNCFSEEAYVIQNSILYHYFDAACFSFYEGVAKPDAVIFEKCFHKLGVDSKDCLYVGDGGSCELDAASKCGMHAVQALWYLKSGTRQPVGRLPLYEGADTPLDVLSFL